LELRPTLALSVSRTTRAPRPGEIDGREYHFVSPVEFQRLIDQDAFLEWAEIYGHRSGTLWAPVRDLLEAGRDVVLEIDMQGAASVRRRVPDAVLLFLQSPSRQELERRLRARHTESEAAIDRRLAAVEGELAAASWFDHVVVNDQVDRAAAEVAAIIDDESGHTAEEIRT
jgi:guanylate kinase